MKSLGLYNQNAPAGAFWLLVAGTRIALMPAGYEPAEVLLLQPAIFSNRTQIYRNKEGIAMFAIVY